MSFHRGFQLPLKVIKFRLDHEHVIGFSESWTARDRFPVFVGSIKRLIRLVALVFSLLHTLKRSNYKSCRESYTYMYSITIFIVATQWGELESCESHNNGISGIRDNLRRTEAEVLWITQRSACQLWMCEMLDGVLSWLSVLYWHLWRFKWYVYSMKYLSFISTLYM